MSSRVAYRTRRGVVVAEIRALQASDRVQWVPLWNGYLRFYRAQLSDAVTETTFARLIDPQLQPHALVAEREGTLLGFTHYLFHRSTWSVQDSCYLEDLFVAPAARGGGVARALIHAVYAAAERAQAATVYWLTQEFNAPGRALYDTLARRTSFIRYER
jgi:GNAT superfamily N-acetyltransferase